MPKRCIFVTPVTRCEALQGRDASREGMTPTVAHKVILTKKTRKSFKAMIYIWQVAASYCLLFVFCWFGEMWERDFLFECHMAI